MRRTNTEVTTVKVTPGADVHAVLPQNGVLRFERNAGAMAGIPTMAQEDGALVMHYADGASLRVAGA